MAYQATLCYLSDIKKIEDANRIVSANALGYYVIVSAEISQNTQLGVVFPSDGRLTHDMLMNNNLYRKNPATGEAMGGYFEANGRVKSIKLRGVKSEAFWTPVSSLLWTGLSLSDIHDLYNKAHEAGENYSFDTLNGYKICEKYYTPATLRAMNQSNKVGKKTKKPQDYAPDFVRHFDTSKLREVVQFFTGKDIVFQVSEKLHGTSGRTGNVLWTKRNWYQNLLSKIGLYRDKYRVISGTRRVVYDPDKLAVGGYYENDKFRQIVHDSIGWLLHEGEVLYYEIVGYTDTGALIMDTHGLDKTTMKESGIPSAEYKQYGDVMRYTYGCEPDNEIPFKVYVYRITQDGVDLSYREMRERAAELGLYVVPHLGYVRVVETDSVDDIMKKVEVLTRGNSVLDDRHIKEGVCLRIEDENGIRIFKYKSFMFCLLEGIRKNSDEYVDLEEIS